MELLRVTCEFRIKEEFKGLYRNFLGRVFHGAVGHRKGRNIPEPPLNLEPFVKPAENPENSYGTPVTLQKFAGIL